LNVPKGCVSYKKLKEKGYYILIYSELAKR
jgi:hypothetical protein